MKRKRRKIRTGRLVILLLILVAVIAALLLLVRSLLNEGKDDYVFNKDELVINELDYSEMKELDISLYSRSYMLIRLNDFKVLYGKNISQRFYPASLTKVVTLDTVVANVDDLDKKASYSAEDYWELIEANASLAGLKTDTDYPIRELLYALVLPSGADAGRALENYFDDHGKDLVGAMNALVEELSLADSHFTNTAGLHDSDLYTSLDDYARIVIDALLRDEAKAVLKTFEYELSDGLSVTSTLEELSRSDVAVVYGGKTGFTGEAGENIMVLYSHAGRSYMLILANAPGNPYNGQLYHFMDVSNIFDYLYN